MKENLIKSGCILVIRIPNDDGVSSDLVDRTVLYKEDYESDKIVLVDLDYNDWFYVSVTLEMALATIKAEVIEVVQPEHYNIISLH